MTTTREPGATVAALKPVTIVTGGSDGIGRAIARRFVGQGHTLLLVARGQERLVAAAAELRTGFGADVHILALDITSPDAAAQIDTVLARAGGYAHILVKMPASASRVHSWSRHETMSCGCWISISRP